MNERRENEKKSYAKPELKRVHLEPEESLVAGCKTFGDSAPMAMPCDLSSCLNNGS